LLPLTSAILILAILASSGLVGCGPSAADLEAVDYAPLPGGDWEVSTPEEQGLDPRLVATLYRDAAEMETLYGPLVVKNGYLIAEQYFNTGSVDEMFDRASATKSFTSALVGIALDQGCLRSVDQKMMDFFPEFASQIDDPRKEQITIRDLLQMRAGYPDEEFTPPYMEILYFSDNWHHVPHLVDFPLTADPGAQFQYSNLTSHLLAVIVARACHTDLRSFAQEYLFSPMDAEVGDWYPDADNYRLGGMGIFVTARDMAKFGSAYLNDGEFGEKQLVSADWVRESLHRYSSGIKRDGSSRYGQFRDLGYGYQWWSAAVGRHRFDYAAGHGGNYIILLRELDMIIVTTADPMHGVFGGESWKHEGAINRLVGGFIDSLPSG
jgi:CubicO group peptidase (beta-lactamase class C family)